MEFDFVCPYCGSRIIYLEVEDVNTDEMTGTYICMDCKKEWQVIFSIQPKELILE